MKITFNGKKIDNKDIFIIGGIGLIFITSLIYMLIHFSTSLNEPEIPDPADMSSKTLIERVRVSKVEYCDKLKNPIGVNVFKCYRYSEREKQWIFYKTY